MHKRGLIWVYYKWMDSSNCLFSNKQFDYHQIPSIYYDTELEPNKGQCRLENIWFYV